MQGIILNVALSTLMLGVEAAVVSTISRDGALFDTNRQLCLSDAFADYQLYAAASSTPDNFTLSGTTLTLNDKSNPSTCDVSQGNQLECNLEPSSGSSFGIDAAGILSYKNGSESSSIFYACTNNNGNPSSVYFTKVGSVSPNCQQTTLKIIPYESCPGVQRPSVPLYDKSLKDLTTGICLSDYAASRTLYAQKGSPVDTFSLVGTKLSLEHDNTTSLCVTSEAAGQSTQFQCSNDIDYDGTGHQITSSYAFNSVQDSGETLLQYYTSNGTLSTTFYGCGPTSAVYFAVTRDPGSAPGVCHAAQFAFVESSQC